MKLPTRIISDVHFGHPASYVRDPRQLAPLAEGAERLVFNGDSVEMRFARERERAVSAFAALEAVCAAAGAEPVFITGNHDPAIGDGINHLDLAGEAVLVTHGDILFHGLSPWSRECAAMKARQTLEMEALGNPPDLERRLLAIRRAAASVGELSFRRHPATRMRTPAEILHEAWPPWRVLRILGCWATLPGRANALAAECRPRCRVVAVGHTHYGGIWRRGGRMIVNTGSFLPYSGRLAVDVGPNEITVRTIDGKNGSFAAGRVVARQPLETPG